MALSLIAGWSWAGRGSPLAPWVLDAIGMPEDSPPDALTYVRLYFCAIPFLTITTGQRYCGPTDDAKRPLYALAAAVVGELRPRPRLRAPVRLGHRRHRHRHRHRRCPERRHRGVRLRAREGPFRLHLRELRICGPELAGILRIGIPAGIQGAVFSLSNTVVQATINGFGSAAIAARRPR